MNVHQSVKVIVIKKRRNRSMKAMINDIELYDADPNCKHQIVELWSGVKCRKCTGWFCY